MSRIITLYVLVITSVNTKEVNEETQLKLLNQKLAEYNKFKLFRVDSDSY